MKIIFSAVLGGMVTGQVVTSEFMIRCLREKSQVVVNRQPAKGIFFLVQMLYYMALTMLKFILIRPHISYIVLNRTSASFYTRDLVVLILSRLFAGKTVIHVVGNDFEKYWVNIGKFGRWVYNWICGGKVVFVVLGSLMEAGIRSALSEINPCPVFVKLPAFIDDESIRYVENTALRNTKDNSRVKIGFMSNLIPEKGVFEFCKSIEILSQSNENIDFWIAGKRISGVDYKILDELIKAGHVTYYEFISGKSKWDLLCETNIFVLPTYYPTEYLPLSIIDALVAGCIVVSCDTGEIAEYIYDDNGLLIEPRSSKALEGALAKLIEGDFLNYDKSLIGNNIILKLNQFKLMALDKLLCH